MERNLKAAVRYDGTGFAGWQVQPNARTIQGEIERALSTIASQAIRIHGSGRTDAGVHALGQVCSFRWPGEHDPARLCRSLSKMLAPEIRVERIEEVPPEFDARYSAVAKRYAYAVSLGREADPFSARYAWCLPRSIDVMHAAALAGRLVGQHDFAGFQCSNTTVQMTVRTMHSVVLHRGGIVGPCDSDRLWRIEFCADGFLYKMIRNIMGTVVDIARGTTPQTRLDELLASPGPFHGYTAPAHGLALMEVRY
jgi:tRNA pseudouridine38-40 synthase